MNSWRALLDASHEALRTVTVGLTEADKDKSTPCEKWTVTQVLQHATGDQIGYAAAITGGPWPSDDPFLPSGRLDGDPVAFVESGISASAAAYAQIADDDPSVATPLPQGAMPAWQAAGACALDAAIHAWDIAVATGQRSPLTADMARGLMEVAITIVEPLRGFAYGPNLPAAPGDRDIETLLRYLGRDPRA
ncbi:TIGR03086 family metal-binding protein [Planosporangium sp. 12N6]|uniref:TIGR03086 family metal-binding protein n=1 Tax=Planosporangium spinosum TaxID=3402278 RepID=UPI003CFB4505